MSPAQVDATPRNALRPIGSQGAFCADKEAGTSSPWTSADGRRGSVSLRSPLEGSDLFRTCWKELLTREATRNILP